MHSSRKYEPIAGDPDPGNQDTSSSSTYHEIPARSSSESSLSIQNATNDEEMPESPPPYERGSFEEFDIEEPEEAPSNRHGFLGKAGEFAQNINARIITPINEALDPVYEAWKYISTRVDSFISRIGNPLIIKRLMYVIFVAVIIYMISMSGIYRGRISSYGVFDDLKELGDAIENTIDPHRLEENLEYLSSMPRMAGTAADLALARYVQQYIKKTSLERIGGQEFLAFTEYPSNKSSVVLVGADGEVLHTCNLVEDAGKETTSQDISLLAFNPGSKSGDASGRLVYLNYGSPHDYQLLQDVGNKPENGYVALIRYGGGIPAYKKLQLASKNRAVGVLFISDPSGNSPYTIGSIQREPVAYPDKATGNIMDPGPGSADQIPDYFDTSKLLASSSAYPKIPSIPISWIDFKALMEELKGNGNHMSDWDLEIEGQRVEIWTGDDQKKVKIVNSLEQRPFKQMWNVIGRISGSEQNGLAVMVGASRDAVCYGATEATGTTVLLELMSILSEMKSARSWRPLRTIYFVSFSGTKYNAAGSSNLVVQREDMLRQSIYAYLDLNAAVAGRSMKVRGSDIFHGIVNDAMHQATDPAQNVSLFEVWDKSLDKNVLPGSNASPFSNRVGMGTLELSFENKSNPYPQNSCLDTFERFKKSAVDPDMSYHKALTSSVLRVLLELTDQAIIPFDIQGWVREMNDDAKDLRSYASSKAGDGKGLNFDRFERALILIKEIGREHDTFLKTWSDIVNSSSGVEPNLLAVNRWDWNSKLSVVEKLLTAKGGTDGRGWQRNLVHGQQLEPPYVYSDSELNAVHYRYYSYPGVRDEIAKGNFAQAQVELDIVTELFVQCARAFEIGEI